MSQPFLASEFTPAQAQDARFHIIPVPYEASVSYGHGTAKGPEAILAASQQLEAFDGQSMPGELGLYTAPAVACTGSAQEVMAAIEEATAKCLSFAAAVPVLLGGEHSVSLGALRALKKKYASFGIVHFDAHADLRIDYEDNPYSHASVMYRAVHDLGIPLVQFGVRDFCLQEVHVRKEYGVTAYDAALLHAQGLPRAPIPAHFPEHIYISFDVDAFDASLMPATGTPVPGGLSWYDVLTLVERSVQGRKVIGLDVVELAPMEQLHFCDYTAARILYYMLGIIQRAGC